MQIVVTNVHCRSLTIQIRFWSSIRGNPNGVMKISDGVVSNYVAWPVNFDRIVAGEQVRRIRADITPPRPRPADQPIAVQPAQEQIVGNVEFSRTRVLRPDAESHVLESAIPDSQIGGTSKLLL